MSFKNLNLIFVSFIFIILLIINYILYYHLVPNLNLNGFSSLGFISNDSFVFHKLSLNYLESNLNLLEFIGILYDVNFHIFFLSLIYFFSISPFFYTLINIVLVILCISIAFQIIDEKIDSNKKNQIFIAKSSFTLLTIFLPSNFFFYSQIGKECFVILSLFYLIKFFLDDRNFVFEKKYVTNFIFLFLSTHVLVVSKDYIIFTFIICSWVLILLLLITKNLNIKHSIFFNKILLISFLAILVIILKFILQLGNTANFIDYYDNVVNANLDRNDLYSNFIYESNHIFDKLTEPFNKIRYFLVNYSIINGANSLVSTEIPINFNQTVFVYLKTLFFSLIYPANYFANNISLLNKIAISENLIYLILIFSIFLIKNKNNKELLFIAFYIFILSVILYLNPNIGSFYKQKSLFLYTTAIYGIINWIKIFQYINKSIFISIDNKKNQNDLSVLSSNSFKILILIVAVSVLILSRDLFIINSSFNSYDIEIYLLLILSMSIISNSINTPLNELLISYYYQKNKIDFKFLVLILSISLVINILIYTLTIDTAYLNFFFISVLTIIFYVSILINSSINTYFIYSQKIFYIYFAQTISIIISLVFLFFTRNNLTLINIVLSLNIWILANIFFNLVFVNNDYKEILSKFTYNILNRKDMYNFVNNYFSYILLNGSIIILILLSTSKYIDDSSLVVSLRLYLYILGILIVIFNLVISPYLFKNSDNNKISEKISKFIELVFISSLLFILIILISFDWLLDISFSFSLISGRSSIVYLSQILILGFPFVILNYFFTKKLLSINDFKSANIVNLFASLLFFLLVSLVDKKNIELICYFFLFTNLIQFFIFNYLIKNKNTFQIKLISLFPALYLFSIFFLIKFELINNFYLTSVVPISILLFKKKFYD